MSSDTKKLELYALLAIDEDLDVKTLVQEFKIPWRTLNAWKTKFKESKDVAAVDKLLNTDHIIIDRIASEVFDEVVDVTPETLVIEDGKILTETELEVKQKLDAEKAAYKEGKLSKFRTKITGLQELKTSLQATAGDMLNLIATEIEGIVEDKQLFKCLTDDEKNLVKVFADHHTKDIKNLTDSLTSIQNAFFNKPTTNIAVGVSNGENTLDTFITSLKA